jgi:hypothetical protein
MHGLHRRPPRFPWLAALVRLVRPTRGLHNAPRGGDLIPTGPMQVYYPPTGDRQVPRPRRSRALTETRADLRPINARPYYDPEPYYDDEPYLPELVSR